MGPRFARIFGLRYDGPTGHFAAVQVNDALTLDFSDAKTFDSHHLAFKVSDDEFDAIFGRVQAEGIPFGSGPYTLEDMKTNTWGGGRGVYFKDSNGPGCLRLLRCRGSARCWDGSSWRGLWLHARTEPVCLGQT